MVEEFVFWMAVAAVTILVVLAIVFLIFQRFTGFPLRWGWRRHVGPSGKVLPKNDRDA